VHVLCRLGYFLDAIGFALLDAMMSVQISLVGQFCMSEHGRLTVCFRMLAVYRRFREGKV